MSDIFIREFGNPGGFTILELATMVKELTGSKSEIVFQPLPQDDPVDPRSSCKNAPFRGFSRFQLRRHGTCGPEDGNRSPGENRPMTVPMERVENRILSIRGHRVMLDSLSLRGKWG
jgi:hypothetical protein